MLGHVALRLPTRSAMWQGLRQIVELKQSHPVAPSRSLLLDNWNFMPGLSKSKNFAVSPSNFLFWRKFPAKCFAYIRSNKTHKKHYFLCCSKTCLWSPKHVQKTQKNPKIKNGPIYTQKGKVKSKQNNFVNMHMQNTNRKQIKRNKM